MYLYSFVKYAGFDRVFSLEARNTDLNPGDLVKFGEDIFLVLGEEISFAEKYTYPYRTVLYAEVVYAGLISPKALQMIHRMVYERYSSYKGVMKYFLSQDILKLLERIDEKKGKKLEKTVTMSLSKPAYRTDRCVNKVLNIHPSTGSGGQNMNTEENVISEKGQNLIVFPDVWTLINSIDEKILEHPQVSFLFSTQTQNQQDRNWWKIKNGVSKIILGTHAEIFQDYHNLKKIIFIDAHKWYYTNHQDPRYKTGMVIDKMQEVYGCEVLK